jgi:two-component system sensor histidine kinase DegS
MSTRLNHAYERLRTMITRQRPWLVGVMLVVGTALHYSAQIRSIPETHLTLTRHAMERVLFMFPVVYAAFTLGMVGGLIALFCAVLAMLPRIFFISPTPVDALVETIAVALVGVLVSYMVEAREREKRLRLKALADLDRSEAMLRHYLRQIIQAQEDERRRLARELHDDTAQALVILSHRIDALDAYRDRLPAPVIQRLEGLLELADDILRGVRRFSRDLRPPVLDDLGLVPALESLTSDLTRQGIRTEFEVVGHRRSLSADVELTLFRIAQEALRNVLKHAEASDVWLRVEFEDASVRIEVKDSGRGFRMPDEMGDLANGGRLGLLGMQERAELIGADLDVQSEPGNGTIVAVRVMA